MKLHHYGDIIELSRHDLLLQLRKGIANDNVEGKNRKIDSRSSEINLQ